MSDGDTSSELAVEVIHSTLRGQCGDIRSDSRPGHADSPGAALLPADANDLYVRDFDRHIQYAEGFHRRWMGSNEAKLAWCERVSGRSVDMLCPQHGAIYRGADVGRFINWFSELKVGVLK